MGEPVREYETVFVVQPEISEEGRQAIADRLDGVLVKRGATRFELDDWGKRKLAYEIRKFQKGHYLVLHYGDDGAVVSELERALRLDDSVLRYLTIQVDQRVEDLDKRKAEGEERERIQREKAAERAREAEEIRARAEAAAAEAAVAAKAAEEAAEAEKAASAEQAGEPEGAAAAEEAAAPEEAGAAAADAEPGAEGEAAEERDPEAAEEEK